MLEAYRLTVWLPLLLTISPPQIVLERSSRDGTVADLTIQHGTLDIA